MASQNIDGVLFETYADDGPAMTRFWSRSEDAVHVLQAVAVFCETLGVGGPTDFVVRFNTATCPKDYINGTIEWVGF